MGSQLRTQKGWLFAHELFMFMPASVCSTCASSGTVFRSTVLTVQVAAWPGHLPGHLWFSQFTGCPAILLKLLLMKARKRGGRKEINLLHPCLRSHTHKAKHKLEEEQIANLVMLLHLES